MPRQLQQLLVTFVWLSLFLGCAQAGAITINKTEIATDISADGEHCWYDDTRVIVLRRTRPPGGRDLQTEGLYVLDVTKPREVTRLDLTPLSSDVQRDIIGLSCQEQTIVFSRFLPGRQVREFYTMALDRRPERLAELRGAPVSLRGRYLLGSSEKGIRDAGPLQGSFQGKDDCDVRYVRPGFRVLCWDSLEFKNWPLTTWVLSEYQRREMIKVRAEDGGARYIPNPTKPMLDKDGKPVLLYGLYLRDLEGQIVVSLGDDPKFRMRMYGSSITADEQYLYAVCSERTRRTDEMTAVCRYRLDGKSHEWEEVFRIDGLKQFKYGIAMISVSNTGDVYFSQGASRWSIWRFDARSRKFEELTSHSKEYRDENPIVSPNGRWVIFVRSGKEGTKLMLMQGGAR